MPLHSTIRFRSLCFVLLSAALLAMFALPAVHSVAAPASLSQPTPTLIVTTPIVGSSTTGPDIYEPNNAIAAARPIELGGRIDNLAFLPQDDVDDFVFFVKPDMVGLTVIFDTAITYGLDTRIRVLHPDGSLLAENDDASPGDKRSHLVVPLTESGYIIIEVSNASIVPPGDRTYALETRLVTAGEAAAQPTPGPAGGAPDAYENNYDFAHAPEIPVGQSIDGLNFLCPPDAPTGCGDNDFFAVSLKGGVCYTAQTSKLAPGIDTNLIVYGPDRDTAPPWAGNDDVAPGVLASEVRFCVPAKAGSVIGYILVGNAGNRAPPAPAAQRTYSLRIDVELPPTPTPAPATSAGNQPPATAPTNAPLAAADAPKGAAIVIAKTTALRSTPDAQGVIIQTLPQETMVVLQGQASGAWVRVQVANGVLPGWVYGPDLKRIDEAAATAVVPAATRQPANMPADAPLISTAPATNAMPTPHISALQPSPAAVPAPVQRIPLSVAVALNRGGVAVSAATPMSSSANQPANAPLQGMRVQLVNAFGDVLAEAVTPDSSAVTLRRDIAPGTAVFIRVPSLGVQAPVDLTHPDSRLTITIPIGG